MTINTQNSFLISSFLHLLFIAVFIAMPKPEYKPEHRTNQVIDISFLFSNVENEAQTNKKVGDKPDTKVSTHKTSYETRMSHRNTKENKNVIPAKLVPAEPAPAVASRGLKQGAGIHGSTGSPYHPELVEGLDSRLHGNDGLKEINQEYQKAHSSIAETVEMPIEQKAETLNYGISGHPVSQASDMSPPPLPKGSEIAPSVVRGAPTPLGASRLTGSKDTAATVHAGTGIGSARKSYPVGAFPQGSHRFSSGVDKSAIISSFVNKIESLKHYPYIARRRGMEGTVIVFVHISKAGELKEAALRMSSGYEILDRSALDLIKKAIPFRHGYHSDLKIEIPITYKLLR